VTLLPTCAGKLHHAPFLLLKTLPLTVLKTPETSQLLEHSAKIMASYGEESSELSTSSILKRDIAWDTYLTARLISDRDLQLIRRYDKRSAETQKDLLEEVRDRICIVQRCRVS
jgi:hypothetical protein